MSEDAFADNSLGENPQPFEMPIIGAFTFEDGHHFLRLAAERRPKNEARERALAIIHGIEERAGLGRGAIRGQVRARPITEARHDAMAAVSEAFPGWSLPRIGRLFNRDHTTVLHALRKRGVKHAGAVRVQP